MVARKASPTAPEERPRSRAAAKQVLYPLASAVVFLLLWEGITRTFEIPTFILPTLSGVARTFVLEAATLPTHAWVTFIETLAGFLLAVSVGIGIALIIVHWQGFEWMVYPHLVLLRTVPIFAIAPLLIMWFGFGLAPKIIVSAVIAFFPIVINMTRGLRAVDYRILELMESVSASAWDVLVKVRLKASLPYLFAALKISITSSMVGAVVGEFLGADEGMGYLVIQASTRLDSELLFMAIIILAAMGVLLFFLVALLESSLVFWKGTEEPGV